MKRPSRSANRRLVGAAVVSGLLLVPLGVFGSSALARTATGQGPSAAQYQYKVLICHHTGSKKHPWHEISVSNRAVAAHLKNHHDYVGHCTTSLTQSSSKSADHDSGANSNASGSNGHSGNHGKGDDNGHHGKS